MSNWRRGTRGSWQEITKALAQVNGRIVSLWRIRATLDAIRYYTTVNTKADINLIWSNLMPNVTWLNVQYRPIFAHWVQQTLPGVYAIPGKLRILQNPETRGKETGMLRNLLHSDSCTPTLELCLVWIREWIPKCILSDIFGWRQRSSDPDLRSAAQPAYTASRGQRVARSTVRDTKINA